MSKEDKQKNTYILIATQIKRTINRNKTKEFFLRKASERDQENEHTD